MDTTDFLLLYFGACCLGAAIIGLMCERAPVMDWQDEPQDRPLKDVPPLKYGGVIQRAKPAVPPARVMPSALVVKTWRDPKTDTTHPLRCVRRDRETGNIYTRPPVLEHVHPAQAETDAQAATLIAELWRYPSTIPEDDDGA